MTDLIPAAHSHSNRVRRSDVYAVVFAMVFPTLVTLVYFQWLRHSESSLQQIAFGMGKLLQFSFPVIYVWLFHRDKLRRHVRGETNPDRERLAAAPSKYLFYGIGFGLFVAVALFAIYFSLLAPTEVATNLKAMVADKINSLGINSVAKYAALLVFYSICHSFMEEYYWRWFVFDFLGKFLDTWTANIISSFGFMAHHVVVLGFFFGFDSPLAYLFSLAVATGGSCWAWLYTQSGSLRSSWISHMIVDAAIFSLGYFLIHETVF